MIHLKKFNEQLEDGEFSFWEIWYRSCEGNKRWYIAKAPIDWDEYDVRERITMGGYGDDPAEIISIERSYDDDYSMDYTD